MPSTIEVEARLREYARRYDQQFPQTAGVERRISARIAITPQQLRRAPTRREWVRAGGLVRELAMVCVLLLLVSVLVVGVTRLRGLSPSHSSSPVVKPNLITGSFFSALHFVSADVGWIAESKSTPAGPTVVYRTTDGGQTWQGQLTWDGPGPAEVRFSSDGADGLVVGQGGVPLFVTSDGGVHWQRMALPSQATTIDLLYFLDAREGWVVSYLNQATPGFAGVYHTADAGGHWTQTATVDVNQQFSHSPGLVGGSLSGSLMFIDSSTGWMSPVAYGGTNVNAVPPFLYVTHDGGNTWTVQTLAVPARVNLNSSNSAVSLPQFFNRREGVLFVTVFSAAQPAGPQGTYAYSTTDGGEHWSNPRTVAFPSGLAGFQSMALLDAHTWVSPAGSAIARTTDGGMHWALLAGGLPTNARVSAVDFQNVNSGWAELVVETTPPSLAIYGTTDGGANWTKLSLPGVSG